MQPPSVVNSLEFWEGWLVQLGFCLCLTILNLWGITWISKLSALFFVLIYMPFIAEIIAAPMLSHPQWEALWDPLQFNEIQWPLFLSTVLWCFGAYCNFIFIFFRSLAIFLLSQSSFLFLLLFTFSFFFSFFLFS